MSDEYTPTVTAYGETAVLWSLMQGDAVEARRIIGGMLPREREEFSRRAWQLYWMIGEPDVALKKSEQGV